MSEKCQRPDHIRIVKAVCVEYGNTDDTWTWSISMCVRR